MVLIFQTDFRHFHAAVDFLSPAIKKIHDKQFNKKVDSMMELSDCQDTYISHDCDLIEVRFQFLYKIDTNEVDLLILEIDVKNYI